ncbi:MAG: tetratricopeptide repeat protein, partial [Bacilli bacterium]|nr:tetratricopeptide repeat protein [Bacilli bacterium]
MDPFTVSILANFTSTIAISALKKVSNNLFSKDIESLVIHKSDFEFIIDQKISLEDFPEVEVKPLAQFLKSEDVELIVQQIYNPGLTRNSIEEIRNEFCLSFSRYFEVETEKCNSFASNLFDILIEGCKITLDKAISQGLISAHDAKMQFRFSLIEDKIDELKKYVEEIPQIVNMIKSSGIMNFPNDQNITIPNNDTILNEIGDWIETAKHSCAVNKDYDEALKIYGIAEKKLQIHQNNELLLKVLVGKAVCYQNKGNTSATNKLLQEAEEIDETHPIVLANISSFLRVNGNIDEAEAYANKALENDQHCILAKAVLALIEHKRGNVTESLKLLREAATIDQNDAYPMYAMSYIYLSEQKYDEAIKYGKEAVKRENASASYHTHLGNVFLEASSQKGVVHIGADFKKLINTAYVQKSIQCFEKAMELNSSQNIEHLNSSIYPNLASAYLAIDEIEKSIEYNEKAIECGVEADEIYVNLGMAYLSLDNFDKCIEYYQPLVDKGVKSFVIRANLALAYLFEGKLDEAEFLLDNLIEEYPECLHLYIHLSQVKDKMGEIQQGIEILNNASKHLILDWRANYVLGRLYYKKEDYELAAKYFKESIKQNDTAIEPMRDLINLYIECHIPEFAVKYAEDLIRIDNENISVHYYNLSVLYYEMNDYTNSFEYSKRALDSGYEDAKVYRLICLSLLDSEMFDDAKAYFETALNIYPEDLDLNHNFAVLLSQMGNQSEAVFILEKVIKMNDHYSPAHLSLANIYFGEEDYEKAIEYAKNAISIEPENEYAHFVLGNSLLSSGRTDDAVDEFNEVLSLNPNTKYVKSGDADRIMDTLVTQSHHFQDIISEYESGNITLSKASELLNINISNFLQHLNNKKISETLNITAEELNQIEKIYISKKNVVVDIAILEMLATIGELDILKLFFNNVYVAKDIEIEILKSMP